MPDVNIDFFDRDGTLKLFKHTPASMIKDDKTEKHKTGVYFHAIPEHPVTGHASLDYKKAEDRARLRWWREDRALDEDDNGGRLRAFGTFRRGRVLTG